MKTASSVDIANGKVDHIVPLSQEPEGVAVTPDGKTLIVTCETGGDVFFIDIATFKVKGQLKVGPRPRSVAFLDGGKTRGDSFEIQRQSLRHRHGPDESREDRGPAEGFAPDAGKVVR